MGWASTRRGVSAALVWLGTTQLPVELDWKKTARLDGTGTDKHKYHVQDQGIGLIFGGYGIKEF